MFDLWPLIAHGKSAQFTFLFKNFLPIGIALLTILLLFVLPHKSKRGVLITKICFLGLLSALLITKLVFNAVRYKELKLGSTFLPYIFGLNNTRSMGVCVVILAIVTLSLSFGRCKNWRITNLFKHGLLGIGFSFALIAMFKLEFMFDTNENLYHFLNLSSAVNLFCFVFIPLYLVRIGELKPRFNKYWYVLACYTVIMSVLMLFSILNYSSYSEMMYSTSLPALGINVDAPWHLMISTAAFLIIAFAFYMLVVFVSKKLSREKEQNAYVKKNDFFDLQAFAVKSICCMQGFFLITVFAALAKRVHNNMLALLCLLPLFITIFSVICANELERLSVESDETIFEEGNKQSKKVKVYAFCANVLYGLFFMKQFNNEIRSIQDKKDREEKRKLRQQKQQELKNQNKE